MLRSFAFLIISRIELSKLDETKSSILLIHKIDLNTKKYIFHCLSTFVCCVFRKKIKNVESSCYRHLHIESGSAQMHLSQILENFIFNGAPLR